MKLSTVIIAGAALAGAAALSSTPAAAATVFEQYIYSGNDGAFASVTNDNAFNYDDVVIGGEDFGALAAGGSTGLHYWGDDEFNNGPLGVSITVGANTFSGTVNDVMFDIDQDVGPTNIGEIAVGGGVPEPATWAMMLVGFFGMGNLLRSKRRVPVTA